MVFIAVLAERLPTAISPAVGTHPDSTVGAFGDGGLARTVALQLMAHDALGAHARDELGLSAKLIARPLQAALASAATFSVGAALPILTVILAPSARLGFTVSGTSLIC